MAHNSDQEHSKENKTIISFKNSFWLVFILVVLFVAALNFIKAESGGEEGKGEAKEKVEMKGAEPAETKAEAPKPAETAPAADPAKGAK